ncbi:hypothetical protein DL95DRAFT_412165 [Leptodontidium sp. 2 PMI_412]|nr:hypothetical protein DL95DRAFT_412165 [Leptodontidium sp. 2 PMI_412]
MRMPFRRRPRSGGSSNSVSATDSTISTATSAQLALPSLPLQPGDQPQTVAPGRTITALEIRDLNELIRKRYALDVEIWGLKGCRPRDRYIVEDKMKRADVALFKILSIVRMWDSPEVWKSTADYYRLREIRHRLEMGGGKRVWEGNPPWEEESDNRVSL